MRKRIIVVLQTGLLALTAGCTTDAGKGYMTLDALYKEIDENPDDVVNQKDGKNVIYTNIAGRLHDEHEKGMYCELRGNENFQTMNVYFENEDMYESFAKRNRTGDDVEMTVRIYRNDQGDLYAVFAE